jgi:hypothetical protein
VIGIDEVALEVGRQDARAVRHEPDTSPGDVSKNARQRLRPARNRGRTKRCDTISRKSRRHFCHRVARIQRVVSLDAMYVHIDEARYDVAVVDRDDAGAGGIDASIGLDRHNSGAVDKE